MLIAMASDVDPHARRKIDGILAVVLKDVKPTEKEMEIATAYSNELMGRLKEVAPKDVEIISVGSVARGTQLRGASDIDIFLLFPRGVAEERMEKKGLEIAKKIVKRSEKYTIKYAEHPYLMITLNRSGMKADIVPAFKITDSSQRVTAVDRTQLHNIFVNENLTRKQKDDVILLKAFLKSHNIYGAGARVEGFSGYLCELLVHSYGSFTNTIVAFSRANLPLIIIPSEKRELSMKSSEGHDLAKKFGKKLIVIDPTDSNRNVAAVVTDESFARFVALSKLFLRDPSIGLFYGPHYSDTYSERKLERIKREMGLNMYVLHFKVPDIAEDIIWQQVRRLKNALEAFLRKNGYAPALSLENVAEREAVIALFISNAHASYSLVDGPSVFMQESAEKFIKAHSEALGMLFKGDKISVIEQPRYKNPRQALEAALENKEILPSYIHRKYTKVYLNEVPESVAKLIYSEFVRKTTI
jgi:tRNA nucleotidyltransferase (CCA-adding enzyme)